MFKIGQYNLSCWQHWVYRASENMVLLINTGLYLIISVVSSTFKWIKVETGIYQGQEYLSIYYLMQENHNVFSEMYCSLCTYRVGKVCWTWLSDKLWQLSIVKNIFSNHIISSLAHSMKSTLFYFDKCSLLVSTSSTESIFISYQPRSPIAPCTDKGLQQRKIKKILFKTAESRRVSSPWTSNVDYYINNYPIKIHPDHSAMFHYLNIDSVIPYNELAIWKKTAQC